MMNQRAANALNRWRSLEISSGKRKIRLAVQLIFISVAAVAFFGVAASAPAEVRDRFYQFGVLGVIGAIAQVAVCVHAFKSDLIPMYVRDALDVWVAVSSFWLIFTVVLLTKT